MLVKDYRVEIYIGNQGYQSLQMFRVSGSETKVKQDPITSYYKKPQGTSSYDERVIKLRKKFSVGGDV